MTRRFFVAFAALRLVLLTTAWAGQAAVATAPTLTVEEQERFLLTAKVVDERPAGKGVTGTLRLTLTDGTITHAAGFQSIDVRKDVQRLKGRTPERHFADSYKFNIAAYRLATLLGIGHMMPVTVEREYKGARGSLSWWVDNVLMDEDARRKTKEMGPDEAEFHRQQMRQRVFYMLVHDTDRNTGNYMYTKDWKLVMIDFSRAFRIWNELPEHTNILRRCDRSMLAAMRGLTKQSVQKATDPFLTSFEIDALLKRRDIIVKHFDGLIKQMGESEVLY